MSRYSEINKRPLQPGDKVLVRATVTAIGDDPHDPDLRVWFNGMEHVTTVMNVERDKSQFPTIRDRYPNLEDFPVVKPGGDCSGFGRPATRGGFPEISEDIFDTLVADVRGDESLEDLLNTVKTPGEDDDGTGRIAPPNQDMVFDGRRGVRRRPQNVVSFTGSRARSNDTDEPQGKMTFSHDDDPPA